MEKYAWMKDQYFFLQRLNSVFSDSNRRSKAILARAGASRIYEQISRLDIKTLGLQALLYRLDNGRTQKSSSGVTHHLKGKTTRKLSIKMWESKDQKKELQIKKAIPDTSFKINENMYPE